MKYHTLSTASLSSEPKKSTLTIYTEPDFVRDKSSSDTELSLVRGELEIVQRALKLQTKRCRQLVSDYTQKLQTAETEAVSERGLRDQQLSRVLRALLLFEARLRQEQTYIVHQLREKDATIKRQRFELRKYRTTVQFCKRCSQAYGQLSSLEGFDSGSDYATSNTCKAESPDSSGKSSSGEDSAGRFLKNKTKKGHHRVLRQRPGSDASDELYVTSSLSASSESEENQQKQEQQAKETLPAPFEDADAGEKWYASASDQEDDDRNSMYRNNPVLECMNQILLQNISDSHSPPKSPEAKPKPGKKVSFIDESNAYVDLEKAAPCDYYETPVQPAVPNHYEVPQSIYSNDYESILSKGSSGRAEHPAEGAAKPAEGDYYVDMDVKPPQKLDSPAKRSKVARVPPALPPKPANLVSKYKIRPTPPKAETVESEPDYCSISELNLPPEKTLVAKRSSLVVANVERHNQQISLELAKAAMAKRDIPKLPQVSEILIPDEAAPPQPAAAGELITSGDNYVKNNSQMISDMMLKQKMRRPIAVGTSVSTLISGFNRAATKAAERKKLLPAFEHAQSPDKQQQQQHQQQHQQQQQQKLDLSQNFEEFKLDDCEIGEEFQTPPESLQLHLEEESAPQKEAELLPTPPPEPVKTAPAAEPSYEHFLECTGLSSKSILTPSRLLSNHKSMLKPKDVKLRSKVKATTLFERQGSNTIRYWSEPYL